MAKVALPRPFINRHMHAVENIQYPTKRAVYTFDELEIPYGICLLQITHDYYHCTRLAEKLTGESVFCKSFMIITTARGWPRSSLRNLSPAHHPRALPNVRGWLRSSLHSFRVSDSLLDLLLLTSVHLCVLSRQGLEAAGRLSSSCVLLYNALPTTTDSAARSPDATSTATENLDRSSHT